MLRKDESTFSIENITQLTIVTYCADGSLYHLPILGFYIKNFTPNRNVTAVSS